MAFDITKAIGLGKAMPNLDTREIVQIPVDLLDENENNFFAVNDVQDLKDSIEIKGILQPLLVVCSGERYRVIAGHRRRKAAMELVGEGKRRFADVPCIILPEMSDAMEQVTLIQTNTTARDLSYSEKMESARRLKQTLVQLKEEGVHIPGKLRDIVAEQLEISRSELARMQVIEKNLSPEWRKLLETGDINAYCAYELARIPVEDQDELLQKKQSGEYGYMSQTIVSDYMTRKKCSDWLVDDCPLSRDGYYCSEMRSKGLPIPCREYKKILERKEKGHPELCPGCCYNCPDADKCKSCCGETKYQRARDVAAAESAAVKQAQQNAFRRSCLGETPNKLAALFEAEFYDSDELRALFSDEYKEITGGDHVPCYLEFDCMATAKSASDLPVFIVSTAAFCSALCITPNWLLGFDDASEPTMSALSMSGWNRFDEYDPPNGARVTARRSVNGSVFVGEYLFRDGKWYNPDLDEFEVNISNVTHWILSPEGG